MQCGMRIMRSQHRKPLVTDHTDVYLSARVSLAFWSFKSLLKDFKKAFKKDFKKAFKKAFKKRL